MEAIKVDFGKTKGNIEQAYLLGKSLSNKIGQDVVLEFPDKYTHWAIMQVSLMILTVGIVNADRTGYQRRKIDYTGIDVYNTQVFEKELTRLTGVNFKVEVTNEN